MSCMKSEDFVITPDRIEKMKKFFYPESKYPEGIPTSRAERRRAERAAKKPQGRYYTNDQIEEIRFQARRSYMNEVKAEYDKLLAQDMEKIRELRKQYDKESEDYFNHLRDKFHSGDRRDEYISHLIAFMSVSAAVLVEDFGWKPLHGNGIDNNMNMMKFLNGCTRRINEIGADETMDIERYCKQIADKYCVGLVENFDEVLDD